MRTNWIVLVVSISILIALCDAKKKKFSKNEASEGSKSNDEAMKPKEVKTRDEKPSKAKYSDKKAENKQTGRKLNAEDKAEKTSTGSQEIVAHHEEEVVSKSIVAEKTEPATLEAGEGDASPSVQGKPVAKEKKTAKSKAAKKTNKQLKKEKAAVEKEQVPDAAEEPAREIVNEKAEL